MSALPNTSRPSFVIPRLWLARTGAVVVLCAILYGCAGSGSSGRSGEFDPFDFPGEDSVVTANVAHTPREPRSIREEPTHSSRPQNDVESTTLIRVQFYTTTNHSEAEDILARASSALDVPVKLEFDTPYYKLMAGPLPTREEADRLALRLRNMGYESAWVVREQVPASP